MAQFKDHSGKCWNVEINVGAIRRVRDAVGIDLYKIISDSLQGVGELMQDIVKFVDVLYLLCKPQLDAAKVTDEMFGESLSGDALERASNAFVEALIDFFPNQQARNRLREFIEKRREVGKHLLEIAAEQMRTLDPKEEASRLSKSFTNSPELSASTPTDSLSVN